MARTRLLILVFGTVFACTWARAQEIVIVANPGVSVAQLTTAELRDLFTGARSRYADGTRAVPVLLKGGPVHEVFLQNYVRESPDEFRIRWRKAVFTGQGLMPKECNSEAEVLQYVAATRGAIGYVSHVTDAESLKLIRVSLKQ